MARPILDRTWRILLVSAREQAQNAIERVLTERGIDHQLHWVSQSDLALARAQDMMPDVILVDDELDATSVAPLVRQLVARLPGTVVLALVDSSAIGAASQVVLAGARGFVPKPLDPDDLVATLRQVLTQTRAPTREREEVAPTIGRVVVFCSSKGGTGRTTLAVNAAISLHQATRQAVVVVDADYAAPAVDVALNLHTDRSIVDLLPRIAQLDEELVSGVLATHVSGVQALLAPPPASLSESITLPQVQQILVLLKRMFAWVIVDLGLPMDETAFAFLDGADRIVISVLPEMVGLRNSRLLLDQLREQHYPDEKVWLVVNRATMREGITTGDIEGRLHMQVQYMIPDDQPLATHSINMGVPLVVDYPRSALARAIRGFAQHVSRSLTTAEGGPAGQRAAPARRGLFSRLFRRASTGRSG